MKNKQGLMDSLKKQLGTVKYTLREMTEASPKYVIVKALETLFKGVLPVLITYLGALLLEYVAQVNIADKKTLFMSVVLIVILQFGLQILLDGGNYVFMVPFSSYEEVIVNRSINRKVERKHAKINLSHYYNNQFYTESSLVDNNINCMNYMFVFMISFIEAIISLVGLIFLLVKIDILFIFVLMLFTIPSIYFSNKIVAVRKFMAEKYNAKERYENHLSNVLHGEAIEEAKTFGYCDFFAAEWTRVLKELYHKKVILWLKNTAFNVGVDFLANVGSVLCLVITIFKYVAGKVDLADVMITLTIIAQIKGTISKLISGYTYLKEDLENTTRLRDFVEHNQYEESSGQELGEKLRSVRFENVSYSYKNDGVFALKNVNLEINPGDYTAFVGRNGSGKTTIMMLMCGLYTPTSGTIYYNGIPHYKLNMADIQNKFAVVFQNFGEYAITIRENIAFGNDDSDRFDKTVDTVNLRDIINESDKGADTMLGTWLHDEARNLSHGEWQRLAIARAFYKKSDFLLMDEPLSAIDPLTEKKIYGIVKDYSEAQSKSIVSHRLAYMPDMTKIVVLDEGRILEVGTYDELMKNEGVFKLLYEIQASRYAMEDVHE